MANYSDVIRKISLQKPLEAHESQRLLRLYDLPAVKKVTYTKRHICVKYDAGQLQWPVLWELVRQYHLPVRYKLWQHWRYRYYQMVDQNAWQNAHSQSAHCCNKPPSPPL